MDHQATPVELICKVMPTPRRRAVAIARLANLSCIVLTIEALLMLGGHNLGDVLSGLVQIAQSVLTHLGTG